MPTLHWTGKEKVVNHHQDVPYKTLRHRYGFDAKNGQGETPTGSGNKIIHGDNLEALKSLLPEYEGKVKCIYIDPPYNTGNEKWVYNDNVNHPKIKKWLGETVGKEGEDLSRHDKWLCMMYPRLQLLHKLLAEDGFIFVSIDYFSNHLLRNILDEIFGSTNFKNCISVRRGIKNVQAQFKEISALSVGHEYIYLYSKNSNTRLPKLNKKLGTTKDGKWDTFWRGTDRPTMRFSIFGQKPETGQWRWSEERTRKAIRNYDDFLENNNEIDLDEFYLEHFQSTNEKIDFVRKNKDNVVQYYVPPQGFKLLSDNWMDILLSGSYTKFDTEKSVILVNRIVKWICGEDKNSIILDSFAGSGTTAHAVLNLNKEDGGARKFILVEMEDYADSITAERVRRVATGYGTGKNAVEGTGGAFDYYELGQPLFKADGYLNEAVPLADIRRYIWFTETRSGQPPAEGSYFLGRHQGTAYYFCYEKERETTLDHQLLKTLDEAAEQYLIYADRCLLENDFMEKRNLIFKKIPRDITRF